MSEPVLINTRAALREAIRRHSGSSLGLVPTMGALHEGHEALVRAAREANDVVVVTLFVNPLQFGEPQDLERYPRRLDEDLELLARCGADIVFAPSAEEMYPNGEPLVGLDAGHLGTQFEGASRPGHFNGMLTVVSKLFHLAQPTPESAYRAYFGQKDAQQLALVRAMARDLNFPVEVMAVPTVRNASGLALSSRNGRLSPEQQEAALVLSRALRLLKARADAHEPLDPDSAVALVNSQNLVDLDYLEIVDPDTLQALAFNCHETPFTGTALALIAARVGNVRLIDNLPLGSDEQHPGHCDA